VDDIRFVPPGGGLATVLRPDFDPRREALLEGPEPPLPFSGPGTGAATYREITPGHAVVRVSTSVPACCWCETRTTPNWHATIDGHPADVLITDYLIQGVAVPAGTHTVDLSYRDPAIGWGLAASAVAWSLLLAAVAWGWRRRSTRRLD